MYELKVEGMTCGHCVRAVTESVQEIDTQAKVNVDLVSKKVLVESEASLNDIKEAVSEAGYSVTESRAL